MPTESARKTSVRRFSKPDDPDTYIDGPVVDVISFIDAHDSYQESEHTFDNTSQNLSRKTHKVTVTGIDDPSSTIDVERIDSYDTTDERDSFQEAITSLLNSDDPPKHLQTHTIKVFRKDDPGTWYKVQRVDRFSVIDPRRQYQETVFQLKWPDGSDASDDGEGNTDLDNTENSAYDSDLDPPDTSSDGTDINPPWRLDPFQNIVDISWGLFLMVLYDGGKVAAVPMADIATPHTIYRDTTGGGSSDEVQVTQLKLAPGTVPGVPSAFLAFEATSGSGFSSRASLSTIPPASFSSGQNAAMAAGSITTTTSGSGPTVGAPPLTVTSTYTLSPGGALDSGGGFSTPPVETVIEFDSQKLEQPIPGGPVKFTHETSYAISGGGAVTVARLDFSQNGKYDILKTKLDSVTSATNAVIDAISVSWNNGDPGSDTTTYTGSSALSYLDVNVTLPWSDPSDFGTNTSYFLHQFPYWSNGKTFSEKKTTPPYPDPPTYQVITPWGAFTGRWKKDWLHVSNGKHVIQGVLIGNDDNSAVIKKLIYLDGSDYGDVLAAACGTTIDKIQAVYMDKKLSDIKV
jgi:hypothetical protein